jgi:hypothetical protein
MLLAILPAVGFAQNFLQDTLLTIDFENGADSIIQYHHISGTVWQVGQPQKTLLDSGYSATHAMVTDTLNPYTAGTYSYFEIPFLPNNYGNFGTSTFVCPLAMCFQHRSDWDSTHAGGWISVRDNDDYVSNFQPWSWGENLNGNNYYYWIFEIIDELNGGGTLYVNNDTLFNDTLGIKNSNIGWRRTCYNMYWITISPPERAMDTLYYRFSFASDSTMNTTHEGWLIDDIQIGVGTGFCAGAIDEEASNNLLIYPNPVHDMAYIHTKGSFEKGTYAIVDMNGKTIQSSPIYYSDNMSIPTDLLSPGVYVLQLNVDGKKIQQKLIKQ